MSQVLGIQDNRNFNLVTKTFFYFFIFFFLKNIFSLNTGFGMAYQFGIFCLFVFIFSAIFIPKKFLLAHSFILIFSHPDITQDNIDVEMFGVLPPASIWQLSIFGEPIIIWTLLLFSIYFFRLRFLKIDKYLVTIALIFIIIPLINSIYYGFISDLGRVIVDLKFGVMLVLGIIFYNSPIIINHKNLHEVFMLIIAGALSTVFYDFIAYLAPIIQGKEYIFKNLSMDVSKIFTIFIFYWSILKIKFNPQSVLYLLLIIICLLLIFEYQTRWLLLTLCTGFFFLPLKYSFRIFIFVLASIYLITLLYFAENPGVMKMINRFNFFNGLDLETIDPNRYFSIINAFEVLRQSNGYIFGMGAGSFFGDSPFLLSKLSTASYDQASLDAGMYYRLHDIFTLFLFKYGIFGCIVYAISTLKFINFFNNNEPQDKKDYIFYCTLLCMLPTLFTFPFYTSKGVLITALLYSLFKIIKSHEYRTQ